ncbi:MAG TPA: hypothetical protein VMG10_16435 [Gemmataceae bacterium]|nr:hypothetical protein [Gemmataceae bacterium]
MLRWIILPLSLLGLLLPVPGSAPACSLCGAALRQAPTFRQEAALDSAKVILVGTAENPQSNRGTTDLRITHVFRSDPALKDKKVITVKQFIPVSDPKNPPRFLVFCDIYKGEFDPFRGVPLKSADSVEYARKVMKLDPKDTSSNLLFFFRYLDSSDPEISRDAFLEFAKATDKEIAQVARRLDAAKLRKWLKAREYPERLSVYALLLGACGGEDDARFLKSMLDEAGERTVNAYDGFLAGYIHLRPREGWDLAYSLLRDSRKPLLIRLAAARTLSYFHGAQPKESADNVQKCLDAMIAQGELADIAIEDMRRWNIFDRTRVHDILGLYGKKGFDAPLIKRTIVRYALCCKDDAAARSFVEDRRREDADLVKGVEEELQFEK